MTYIEKLKSSAEKVGHIACLGLDPVIKYLPKSYEVSGIKGFVQFMDAVYREMIARGLSPAAVKPNDAFYAFYNTPMLRESQRWDGYNALADIISITHEFFPDVPVILDVKREDIGATAEMYAKACMRWDVEAVTIGPYLGQDSIQEFLKNSEIGAYVLCLTSNKSSKDFQHLRATTHLSVHVDSRDIDPVYMHVLYHVLYAEYVIGSQLGIVVGAPDIKLFGKIMDYVASSGRDVPLLIPGVGTQGGSATDVMDAMCDINYDRRLARINSSSGITHPWKSDPIWKDRGAPPDAVRRSVDAFEKLAAECAL